MTSTLVVGAGSAGCVVAARLSADPAHAVLVLEAGPVWASAALIPGPLLDPGHLPVGPESAVVWRYPGNLVRGKLIGGSGAINGSYFVRPPAADFAAWSAVVASPMWSYEAVLPFFAALETDRDFGTAPGHGAHGPVPVERTADPAPVSREFADACAASGFAEIADLNGYVGPGRTDGFGRVPLAVARGRRAGPALTHLYPALARPNLTVTGGTTVTRLLLRGSRVVGVEWSRGRGRGTTFADRVIVCAGAVESAALLIRSGIGPEPLLRSLGIPVVLPAPVGAWCTDHPEIGVEYPGPEPVRSTVALEYALELDDLELRPYTPMFTPGLRRLGVALMTPDTPGRLTLASADPTVPARIDQGYLRAEHDRARLRAGVRTAAELLRLPLGEIDDAWLRAHLGTSQHLSGTCRMGPADDRRAVVDPAGRVHGIDGLTIADLSVLPVPIRRGPQATVLLLAAVIAERHAV
ncbi:dehydrogenase [Nocardia neocaledoniensis NBRC 108232]|uniref:Putative dehydrogenase (TIGR03970 family) n=1 Tax=Nocardia neocaledoniensis TaxID=236511 RepID=A0A317NAU6_9NOCA|nr:mycofactocin system GMC family oxidoreductase MftG [Nocardia neocaledoniensis]PWV72094.1 putative dehydrogenase (TIGR03970 family) [Nocardia neocaledoniensis]GEM34773.1 dehydrogenase [Nocardia neocaledoniensis NBRC 108232]